MDRSVDVLVLCLHRMFRPNLSRWHLVMSRLKGRFGNFLSRVTGTHYTHTAIVIDGKVCESTFPRAKCTPINRYAAGKPWIVRYVPPTEPLTPAKSKASATTRTETWGDVTD
jgi:hypothetical protein